jgi:hypothetical protein
LPWPKPIWLLPLLALIVSGCSSSPLPPVDQVAEIRLTVTRMPDEKEGAAKPRVVNLKARPDIAEAMDWLNSIDWSQSGTDMAVIGIPQPDGGFTLINKNGQTHIFSFYWDGKFVHTRDNRLIRGGDMDRLKQFVQRVCK